MEMKIIIVLSAFILSNTLAYPDVVVTNKLDKKISYTVREAVKIEKKCDFFWRVGNKLNKKCKYFFFTIFRGWKIPHFFFNFDGSP